MSFLMGMKFTFADRAAWFCCVVPLFVAVGNIGCRKGTALQKAADLARQGASCRMRFPDFGDPICQAAGGPGGVQRNAPQQADLCGLAGL